MVLMRVSMTTKGMGKDEFLADLKNLSANMKNRILGEANKAKGDMESVVESTRKREKTGPSKLSKEIKVEEVVNTETAYEVGVGKIAHLDSVVPYWYIQNFGGKIKSGPVPGEFSDGAPRPGAGGKAFIYGPGGSIMIPIKPIEPKNYIQIAWDRVLTRLSGKIHL